MGDHEQELEELAASRGANSAPEGLVTIRRSLVGVAYIWLTAMAAFGAIGAAVYAVRTSPSYLIVALLAGALAVYTGSEALRTFGYR